MRSLGCLWPIKHVSWGKWCCTSRGLEQQGSGPAALPCVPSSYRWGHPALLCSTTNHGTWESQCWSHCSLGNSLEIIRIFTRKILEVFPFKYCQHTHFRKVCVCFLLPDPVCPDAGIPRNLQITLVKPTVSDLFPGQPDGLGELCCL